jgi:hypothetical protein
MIHLLAALAAWASLSIPERTLDTVGKLALALGPVESKTATDAEWKPLAVGGTIEVNTWIRTPAKSKCVLELGKGTELWINEQSEILMAGARQIEIKVGEVYARVAQDPAPFVAKSEFSTSEVASGVVDLGFIIREPDDPLRKKVSRTRTLFSVLEGKLTIKATYTQILTAGYTCDMVDRSLNTPDPIGNPTSLTLWIHDLLLARGITGEIEKRLDTMLAMLGQYDGEDLSEKGYRALGDPAAVFLLEYLKYPLPANQAPRRQKAARIAADGAAPKTAPALSMLLEDSDPEVRAAAAAGLKRLTGQDLGYAESFWRGEKFAEGAKAWAEWMKKNAASLAAPEKK